MTKIYLVFGDHTEMIAKHLSEQFTILGTGRTLEAASAAILEMDEKPGVFLILGSAVVTGVVNGVVNYNTVLLEHLKNIRLTCPESRIKVIISEKASQTLIEGIVALGIYDIFKMDKIKIEELTHIIKTNKTIANYSSDVQYSMEQEIAKKSNFEVIEKEEEKSSFLERAKESIPVFKAPQINIPKLGMPKINKPNIKIAAPSVPRLPAKGEYPNLIAVYSPAPTGKTFVAVNLALAYAQEYNTILVSEAAVSQVTVTKSNDYRKLTNEWDIVIVDGSEDALKCAGAILLVLNQYYLERVSSTLDKKDLDWSKVWVIANGVPDEYIEDLEETIRLKTDYSVPYMTSQNPSETISFFQSLLIAGS